MSKDYDSAYGWEDTEEQEAYEDEQADRKHDMEVEG
jgi:hypothetical protein